MSRLFKAILLLVLLLTILACGGTGDTQSAAHENADAPNSEVEQLGEALSCADLEQPEKTACWLGLYGGGD
jgi:predicted small lipoprotein YifL